MTYAGFTLEKKDALNFDTGSSADTVAKMADLETSTFSLLKVKKNLLKVINFHPNFIQMYLD